VNPPSPFISVIGGTSTGASIDGSGAPPGSADAGSAKVAGISRRRMRFIEVRAQVAAVADEDGARPPQQRAFSAADGHAQQIRAAGTMLPRTPRSVVEERRAARASSM
jgi:hypothetical protein